MTCIVGMVDKRDGSVWVMGDSMASTSEMTYIVRDLKVWRHGELVLGFCGSFRGRDILASSLTLPALTPDEDPERWLRTEFVRAVRKAMSEGGFLTSFKEGNDATLSSLLIGLRGRLFVLRNDFSIGEAITPYMVIGSGAPEAYGSLFSTRDVEDVKARLVEALDASAYYNGGSVSSPYHFVRSEPWPAMTSGD